MRINKLKAVLFRLMYAGCIGSTMSLPVMADNSSPFNYRGYYGNSVSQGIYSEYRFRPLKTGVTMPQSFGRPSFNRFTPVQQRAVRSRSLPYRITYQPYMPQRRWMPVYGDQQMQSASGYNYFAQSQPAKSFQAPAFTRQYAWEAAQPRGFRRGGSVNYYSNQNNDAVEQSDVSVYRATPVTTQGFQFRAPTRNANYVTFADRIQAVKPASYARPVQAERHVRDFHPVVKAAKARILRPSDHAGQSLMNSGKFRFRPDERFQTARQETVVRNEPAIVPVSYKLADAEMGKTGDNSWNKWSFRPAASAFQDSF